MPRMGIGTADQRSSSTFRFEEGRGVIADCKVRVGSGQFNSDKCVLVVALQRLGRDGKPTEDDVVEEEMTIGKLTKFHPGTATSASDEDPQDLGDDAGTEGNCIYATEGAHPDPKSKASAFGKSLEDAGLRPALLNGYCPNLIGLDANWSRQMVKYSGLTNDKGGESEGSNLIVKVGDGNILNLSEINKRDNTKTNAAASKQNKQASAGKTNAAPPKQETAPANDGEVDGETAGKAVELIVAMQGKAEQTVSRAKFSNKFVTMMAAKRVPPPMHKPLQALIGNKEWLDETLETVGFSVEGDSITIPANV